MIRPDPVLTASVFCDGLIDEAIHGAIAPFREALRQEAPGWAGGIWMVRYGKGGMHLKLRVHGPGAGGTRARDLLREHVEAFLAALPSRDAEAPRAPRPELPVIDDEDRAEGGHPDRSLLWTTYRRSHVNLGPDVFLADDGYVARMATALAAAGDIVLDAVEPGLTGGRRLTVLRRAVLGALRAAELDAEQRAAYLAYHRGWLLRFLFWQPEMEEEAVTTFDGQAARMGAAVDQLRRDAAAADVAPGERGDWEHAVASLAAHVSGYRDTPGYDVDPYSADPVFPAVFKALHGLANQLGVDMRNEAFVHHLLLRAHEPQAAGVEA